MTQSMLIPHLWAFQIQQHHSLVEKAFKTYRLLIMADLKTYEENENIKNGCILLISLVVGAE